jgi:hypothetical protein
MKIRTDRIANRLPTDDEAYYFAVLKALKGEAGAARFQAGSKKDKSTPKEASVPQEEKRKGSPVKRVAGASRGGLLSKKDREVMGLAKDQVDGKVEEAAPTK